MIDLPTPLGHLTVSVGFARVAGTAGWLTLARTSGSDTPVGIAGNGAWPRRGPTIARRPHKVASAICGVLSVKSALRHR